MKWGIIGTSLAVAVGACGPCTFDPDCEQRTCRLVQEMSFAANPVDTDAGVPMDSVGVIMGQYLDGDCNISPVQPRATDSVALVLRPLRTGVILTGDTLMSIATGTAVFRNLCVNVPHAPYWLHAESRGTLTITAVVSRAFEVRASANHDCPPR